MTPLARRLALTVLPAVLLAAVALSTVFGDAGLMRRHQLREQVRETADALAHTERTNHRMLLDLAALDRDPLAIERAIAEEIGRSRDGAVLYRFAEPPPEAAAAE